MARPSVREELLTAGVSVLHRRGFNASSVQDITDAAGVPKGSFYNHFDSKETLGAAAVVRYAQRSQAYLAVLHDKKLPPLARLRKCFEGLNRLAASNHFCSGCLLGNFGAELSDQSGLIRSRVAQAFAAWAETIAGVIAEAQAAGSVAKDFPPETLAGFCLNAWEGALLRAKVDKSGQPLDQFMSVSFAKVLL